MALTNAQPQARYRQAGKEARAMTRPEVIRQMIDVVKDAQQAVALDLRALTDDTQRQMDDCGHDEKYVGQQIPQGQPTDCGGFEWGTPVENRRRLLMLQFMIVQQVRIWRCNGGAGRAVCRFEATDGGLECHWQPITSLQQLFENAAKVDTA